MAAISGWSRAALLALMLSTPCGAADNQQQFWGTDLEAARKTAARTDSFRPRAQSACKTQASY